jgi:hypothetical protein
MDNKNIRKVLVFCMKYGGGKSFIVKALKADPQFAQLLSRAGFQLNYKYVPEKDMNNKPTGHYVIECFDSRVPRPRKKVKESDPDICVFKCGVDPIQYIPEDKRKVLPDGVLSEKDLMDLTALHRSQYTVSELVMADVDPGDTDVYAFYDWDVLRAGIDSKDYLITGKILSENSDLGYGPRCYSLSQIEENGRNGLITFCEIVLTSLPDTMDLFKKEGVEYEVVFIDTNEADAELMLALRGDLGRRAGNKVLTDFQQTARWTDLVYSGDITVLNVDSRIANIDICRTVIIDEREVVLDIKKGQEFTVNPDRSITVRDVPEGYEGREARNLQILKERARQFFSTDEPGVEIKPNIDLVEPTMLGKLLSPLCRFLKSRFPELKVGEPKNR